MCVHFASNRIAWDIPAKRNQDNKRRGRTAVNSRLGHNSILANSVAATLALIFSESVSLASLTGFQPLWEWARQNMMCFSKIHGQRKGLFSFLGHIFKPPTRLHQVCVFSGSLLSVRMSSPFFPLRICRIGPVPYPRTKHAC